jgi:superfamily I DNA/RNA helicase
VTDFTARFLYSEWTNVVDAWQLDDEAAYAEVPRLGRKNRLSAKQRVRLWPVFAAAREAIDKRGIRTWAQVFGEVARHYGAQDRKPFTHIVVDEAQDLGVPELRMLAAIAPLGPDALFFAGDLGQRIFQQPFSWNRVGVNVRGRSHVLKVNYRTSRQIRETADRLLPKVVRDVDGLEEDRGGTVSVFNGPVPLISRHSTAEAEIAAVAKFIGEAVAYGIAPSEVGVFVRSRDQLDRARAAVRKAGFVIFELSGESEDQADRIAVGIMHLAKGLEFKAVVVMACDDDVLPLQSRIEAVADEVELDDVYETERQLLYVACTRARDRLMVSGLSPGSEFLNDLGSA